MTVYLEDRVAKLEEQYDFMTGCLSNLATSFVRLEKRMDGLERRMDRLESRMDGLEQKTDRILEILEKKL